MGATTSGQCAPECCAEAVRKDKGETLRCRLEPWHSEHVSIGGDNDHDSGPSDSEASQVETSATVTSAEREKEKSLPQGLHLSAIDMVLAEEFQPPAKTPLSFEGDVISRRSDAGCNSPSRSSSPAMQRLPRGGEAQPSSPMTHLRAAMPRNSGPSSGSSMLVPHNRGPSAHLAARLQRQSNSASPTPLLLRGGNTNGSSGPASRIPHDTRLRMLAGQSSNNNTASSSAGSSAVYAASGESPPPEYRFIDKKETPLGQIQRNVRHLEEGLGSFLRESANARQVYGFSDGGRPVDSHHGSGAAQHAGYHNLQHSNKEQHRHLDGLSSSSSGLHVARHSSKTDKVGYDLRKSGIASTAIPQLGGSSIDTERRYSSPRRRRTTLGTATLLDRTRSSLGSFDQGRPNPLDVLATFSKVKSIPAIAEAGGDGTIQTEFIFDWDDMLFPTHYLVHELEMDCRKPLAMQSWASKSDEREVTDLLAQCEAHAVHLLHGCLLHGRVVIMTSATQDWVEQSCLLYYPNVRKLLLSSRNIDVVYIQELSEVADSFSKSRCRTEEELFSVLKGRAIGNEANAFCKHRDGCAWKNILCVGDAQFDRRDLVHAQNALAQVHTCLHVKTCKVLDGPGLSELVVQLEMLVRWLELMVNLDASFEMDLEAFGSEADVDIAESVLNGRLPTHRLPRLTTEMHSFHATGGTVHLDRWKQAKPHNGAWKERASRCSEIWSTHQPIIDNSSDEGDGPF